MPTIGYMGEEHLKILIIEIDAVCTAKPYTIRNICNSKLCNSMQFLLFSIVQFNSFSNLYFTDILFALYCTSVYLALVYLAASKQST